jgi:hypothetical protein
VIDCPQLLVKPITIPSSECTSKSRELAKQQVSSYAESNIKARLEIDKSNKPVQDHSTAKTVPWRAQCAFFLPRWMFLGPKNGGGDSKKKKKKTK